MRLADVKVVPVLSMLALATIVVPYAHAGCGLYQPASFNAGSQGHFGSPRLLRTAFNSDDDESAKHEPSMVGTWKEHWISEGTAGIPDGTQVDAGYAQWHSDGTEINISGMRAPMTGDVCLSEWIKTGPRTYRMNHFGMSYDATGQSIVGPARIQQWITLNAKGDSTTGRFIIDQWDEAGNVLAHLEGKIVGTRVTMETGFQSIE